MLRRAVGRHLVADPHQVLAEGHRVEVELLHPAYGYRDLAQRELQQRSGRDHVQRGHLLVEVAQRHDRARAGLDLVEEQQRASRRDAGPAVQFELPDHGPGVEVVAEAAVQVAPLLQIHLDQRVELRLGKAPDQPGLAHLARAPDDERLAPGRGLPLGELFLCEPIHAQIALERPFRARVVRKSRHFLTAPIGMSRQNGAGGAFPKCR